MNTLLGFAFLAILGFCPKAQSADIYARGVSAADKVVIVDAHNNYRLQIAAGNVPKQPRGINLLRMAWDNTLAKEAQKVADKCVMQHSIAKDDRFLFVGQNLYLLTTVGNSTYSVSWAHPVKEWFDEHVKFIYPSQSSGVTGHYTQVVWATTYLVGCGYTNFYDNTKAHNSKLYVCNYGPGGNYAGQPPYITGTSGCEKLCSPPN